MVEFDGLSVTGAPGRPGGAVPAVAEIAEVPPLENGDRLTRCEFERRSAARLDLDVGDALYDYRAYGLRIRSAVPLPFDPLPEPGASEPPAFEPDVTVRLGAVPETLPGGPAGHSLFPPHWQARPGAFLMQWRTSPGIWSPAAGTCSSSRSAQTMAASPTSSRAPRSPPCSNSAAWPPCTPLLLGRSGIGKSSLAAALVERGWPLLADDVTGVVPGAGGHPAGGHPMALPGFSRQRLCADTLDEMGWRGRARSRVRDGMEKYWTPAQRTCTDPLPVRAVFVLAVADCPDVGIDPVPPNLAFRVLRHNTHRRRAMEAMGQRDAHFRALAAMVRHVPVAWVARPRRSFTLGALADRIEAHLRRTGSAAGARAASIRSPGSATPPGGGRAVARP